MEFLLQQNIHAAFLYIVKLNGDHCCQTGSSRQDFDKSDDLYFNLLLKQTYQMTSQQTRIKVLKLYRLLFFCCFLCILWRRTAWTFFRTYYKVIHRFGNTWGWVKRIFTFRLIFEYCFTYYTTSLKGLIYNLK